MAKDNTASNIIMQGKGQYKPLDDSMLQWNAKMQNIRNFEEAKRKNQEQRDLRDKLAEIEALGLPAHLQKKLREDSEEALRQVREEGLDPNSIDFRVKLNRIAGKGKQYEDFVTEGKAAMTQEGMVIEEDEYGTINRRPEYNKKFLSLWDENTEIEDVDALIGEVKEGYSRIAPTLEFTPKEYSELADEFFARNSDAYTTMQELKQQGIEGQNLITETLKVHPDLAEGFNSHMDDATRWVAGQNYARDREIYGVDALGTGADYHKRMSSAYHIRPEQQTKQTTGEERSYLTPEEKGKRQRAQDKKDSTGFDLKSTTHTIRNEDGTLTDYSAVKLGPVEVEDGTVVDGVVWIDEVLYPIIGGKAEKGEQEKAEAYIEQLEFNKADKIEKGALRRVVEKAKDEAPKQGTYDQEKIDNITEKLKESGGWFNDDEDEFATWLNDELGLGKDKAGKANLLADKDFMSFLKENASDFTTEEGRKRVIEHIQEKWLRYTKGKRKEGAGKVIYIAPNGAEIEGWDELTEEEKQILLNSGLATKK